MNMERPTYTHTDQYSRINELVNTAAKFFQIADDELARATAYRCSLAAPESDRKAEAINHHIAAVENMYTVSYCEHEPPCYCWCDFLLPSEQSRAIKHYYSLISGEVSSTDCILQEIKPLHMLTLRKMYEYTYGIVQNNEDCIERVSFPPDKRRKFANLRVMQANMVCDDIIKLYNGLCHAEQACLEARKQTCQDTK
jgi:hypothetical protein